MEAQPCIPLMEAKHFTALASPDSNQTGDLLVEHTLAAMLPDEAVFLGVQTVVLASHDFFCKVSVVYKQVKRIAPESSSEECASDDD